MNRILATDFVWQFSNRIGTWLGDFEEVGICPSNPRDTYGADSGQLDRKMAIMCYLSVSGWLTAYRCPRERRGPLTAFHLRQMTLVTVISAVVVVMQLLMLPFLGWSSLVVAGVGLGLLLLLRMMGVMAAMSGLYEPLPLIGGLAQRLFAEQ
ncbi:hypothetical protein LJ737_22200 [Hymenobacter sp. 15J16-1T3B]|uniref:hypothetical protein n=1 Tax=Hymenobacter sp. 15J16-1T3B TaxID=2886941 RepID=UPI001D11BCB8|nr:hypothetical protein [Hymenobacter sp. 15J16-1T3B]MCC3159966.1 hypothetical protein [Hymenobacter sp. 15J16-1T3B]